MTGWGYSRSPCSYPLAGRNPSEAVGNFLDPLQRAASCVTRSVFRPSSNGYKAGSGHGLILNKGEPVTLPGAARLLLSAQLEYDLVKLSDPPPGVRGPWKVATRAYRYHVLTADHCEVALWHWHPGNEGHSDPHLHVGATQLSKDAVISHKNHHPTGRIAFEQVLLQLITEYDGVEAERADAIEQLNETFARFAKWRTWG